MQNRFQEVLSNRESNYMMPFFWMQNGRKQHEDLRARVAEVEVSGCRAFCVESRTHEDFGGVTWWQDMDVLLDEAEKRGMKVWVLDDRHFPTGMANELIEKKYPERRRWFLREEHRDVYGPMKGVSLLLKNPPEEDVLLGAYAYRRTGKGEELAAEWMELTDCVRNGRLRFDVPDGLWRVFFYYKSRKCNRVNQDFYMNMIDDEGVSTLIEAVYEPHYERYAKYFGNTFAGFFSDEPMLGNEFYNWDGDTPIIYGYRMGMPGLTLPWTDEVLEIMRAQLGENAMAQLAGLWYPMEGMHENTRYVYMDTITKLWRRAFSNQLGKWCEAHNVEYIGHVIEDMNAHARTGCSAGHFFRALDGQHMGGIDVVLHQIMPGMADCPHTAILAGGMTDPEFFDYVLAKLAASHSHIRPWMQGRAMCEMFGAYGWAEGSPFMKALMDHMMVRGINHFVPHAFSPIFPNPDCPPHFGAEGMDPQYSGFGELMRYSNKVSHLLCGAVHTADVAIVYHAEAEWCGENPMLVQKPAKVLYDRQIDYDIVPFDVLEEAKVENSRLLVNGEDYGALVMPGCKVLPDKLLAVLEGLQAQGLPVWFVDEKPEKADFGKVVALSALADEAQQYAHVRIEPANHLIRVYRAVRDGQAVYMIVNENMAKAYEGEILLPDSGACAKLDLLLDRVSSVNAEDGRVVLSLAPGQSTMLVFGAEAEYEAEKKETGREAVQAKWSVSLADAGHAGEYRKLTETDKLFDITEAEERAFFAGWMKYEADFTCDADKAFAIDLGEVGQTAQVTLNGVNLGERICLPYVYDLKGALKQGENHIEIVAANTLGGKVRDNFSTYMQIPRSGLLGPVELVCGE